MLLQTNLHLNLSKIMRWKTKGGEGRGCYMAFSQLVKNIRFCRWLRPLIISENLLLFSIQDSQTAWNFFHCTKSSGTSTNNSPTIKESFQSVKYSFLKIPPYNSLFYEINVLPRNIKSF